MPPSPDVPNPIAGTRTPVPPISRFSAMRVPRCRPFFCPSVEIDRLQQPERSSPSASSSSSVCPSIR